MSCENANAARRGIIRLLKIAKALQLTEAQALHYGFCTPSRNGAVQIALIRTWNKTLKPPTKIKLVK